MMIQSARLRVSFLWVVVRESQSCHVDSQRFKDLQAKQVDDSLELWCRVLFKLMLQRS
jgi:hypothetical protein